MLSKSAARLFFVGGTVLFSLVFLALTVDTIKSIPNQTKTQNLTEEVRRGHQIWDANNCMGCHTILGEGAYYAPELTKVYERRGAAWMHLFIKDPEAMYPGQRRMVNYHFTDSQIDDLIAFFKWIGEIDLNDFPPKPVAIQGMASVDQKPSVAASQAPTTFKTICAACHSLGRQGGSVGPALDDVGSRLTADYLDRWLADPKAIKPDTTMPKLPLSDEQRAELVTFLSLQKGGSK